MAPPVSPVSAHGIIKRRIKTPGEVFGLAVKHKVYYGTVAKRDKPRRGDPPVECVTVRYDDGQRCWFPVKTVERWLLPVGTPEAAPAESENLSDESDSDESDQSESEAVENKAGEDINAEKDEDDRHPSYEGKGKQRPWNPKWVSPDGLLLFHQSLLLMVMNQRSSAMDHFSLDEQLRSIVADEYTRDSWAQTFRFMCPYDVDGLKAQQAGTAEYDPYLKFGLIQDYLYDGIHSILVPPKVGSYDEGGKPWTGKGGEGITVPYNPMKPNKRMSMCYTFASFGIPFAWEFYTGQRSNEYNEKKYNTAAERAYGKTVSRIVRLFRRAFGESKGQQVFMDNLFSSIFLFHLLGTAFSAMATGTHRANDNLPKLTWEASYERGVSTKPRTDDQAAKEPLRPVL
ncbi:hypothetical protein CYMTET_5552 [Cymbomonas tetramitiformis]|uniref:PiggyBac transposable element-derived protein domain-containing protein n=1 Tax=Cymbomonas tetramitiformis TaxID=36881 RepID=A0AAE0LIY6_9CHLO|nr:hypothetical protein CYMTET_5552 [Cymbomonas tetramitiformis]